MNAAGLSITGDAGVGGLVQPADEVGLVVGLAEVDRGAGGASDSSALRMSSRVVVP